MNFKDFEKLKQEYSDKVSETGEKLKVLDEEIYDKSLLSNNSKLKRLSLFTGLSYAILLLTSKNFGSISPDILSLIIPLISGSSGYLINKGYESLIVNNGKDELKTTKTILEEEVYKSIAEEYESNLQDIYVLCNNNFYAKEQVDKKFNKMNINNSNLDNRDIEAIKEKVVALNVLLDDDKELLKNLCVKKVMMNYFNNYDSKNFLMIKEFLKTNIVTLISMLGTSLVFAINNIPIDILSVLVSSSVVGTYYGILLNKSNSDNLDVYEKIKDNFDFKELEEYKTLDDIECKIKLLVAEISKIKTMVEEEKILLEEKAVKNTGFNYDYNLINNIEEDKEKSFVRTRKQ